MKCPVCTTVNLVMSERQGVEIDYCPECRGVWLDRGELDKVIERANAQSATDNPQPVREANYPPPHQSPHQGYQGHDRHGHKGQTHGHYYKKKKSLLSEIFDFD